MCHAHDVPLILDEAHGAHFAFHDSCPQPALACGADLVIQSTHKTLSAMTQAAMLHASGSLIDAATVSRALQMLQSSSPSYVLLSSLDAARALAQQPGSHDAAVAAAAALRCGLDEIPNLAVLGAAGAGSCESVSGFDPLRICINVEGLGLTGYEAAEAIERDSGVVPELSTSKVSA